MKLRYEKAQKISGLVIDLEVIDRKLVQIRAEITKNPLTQKQLDLIGLLIRNPKGLTIKDIAEELGVTSSAVVQTIDSFGERKLIARRTDSKDKRSSIAYISERGQQYIKDNLEEFAKEYNDRLFGALSPEELDQFVDLAHRVVNYSDSKCT